MIYAISGLCVIALCLLVYRHALNNNRLPKVWVFSVAELAGWLLLVMGMFQMLR